jgi:sigma-B regulation protein RsbU (phosphoserine phosphatase)
VGAFPETAYERETVRLARGDTIVLFSDGITEAMNPAGEEFGEGGVRATVGQALGRPPDAILQALFDAVAAFTGAHVEGDDLTAMVLRYR